MSPADWVGLAKPFNHSVPQFPEVEEGGIVVHSLACDRVLGSMGGTADSRVCASRPPTCIRIHAPKMRVSEFGPGVLPAGRLADSASSLGTPASAGWKVAFWLILRSMACLWG